MIDRKKESVATEKEPAVTAGGRSSRSGRRPRRTFAVVGTPRGDTKKLVAFLAIHPALVEQIGLQSLNVNNHAQLANLQKAVDRVVRLQNRNG